MANNSRFEELLQNYLAGHATPAEQEELMQLIKSGAYDEVLKQHVYNSLLQENDELSMEEGRAQELLSRILSSEKHTADLITVARLPKKKWRTMAIAIAAVVVLVATVITWQLLPVRRPEQVPVAKTNSTTQPLKPAAVTNGKKYIRLPDGSRVLLNEGSHLEYPESFTGAAREVKLTGEGYFDIKHDESRPFIVHAGKVNTTVLGTAFNIKAFPGEKEITVTVTRGKVKVWDNNKTFGVIVHNESISVNTDNETYHQQTVNADLAIEWKKQYLVLEDISMEDAAVLIGDRYHVQIIFANEEIKQCRISATFLNNENLEQVLTVVAGVVNAAYTIQPNDQIVISGRGCN